MPSSDIPAEPTRADMRFRRATPADADDLSSFARRQFEETFGADNDPRDMAMYIARAFTPSAQADELADPSRICLVGDDDAGIAAYALLHVGATAPPVSGPQPVEIERFYVDARWHGRGLADTLMDLVVDTARLAGATTLWLGVWERNPRAIRFYLRRGFVDVGSHGFLVGTDLQTDRIMTRSVAPSVAHSQSLDGDAPGTDRPRERAP